jgi:predicted metal-dependent hydrolase
MGRHVLEGNPPIEVVLRRTAAARRLSLRISRLDGRVTLTLPRRTPEREGIAFLREREAWLRGHLGDMPDERVIRLGGTVPIEGVDVPLMAGKAARPKLEGGVLWLPDRPEVAAAKTMAFLKLLARDRLSQASDRYAATLGRPYKRLTLRDTRSRWGSCSADGQLMYSWRLIMAPPQVLDYVAAHEIAHLAEMNHSPDFWAVVERLFPAHRSCRTWLRENGDRLHRVRFDG